MDRISFLADFQEQAHQWTWRLLKDIPEEKWNHTPEVIASNITWQVGHMISSAHFHGITCITGLQDEITEKIPLRDYAKLFAFKSPPAEAADKIPVGDMKEHLLFLQEKLLVTVGSLSDSELDKPLHPTKFPNPVAKTKYEALRWNSQHVMWHNGQIAVLKRVLGGS